MNHEPKEQFDANLAGEIEETELETIAIALQVQTGIWAGLSPCL